MNALVMDTSARVGNWFVSFGTAIYRGLVRTGYIRAARELERQGYYEEANKCIQETKKLG